MEKDLNVSAGLEIEKLIRNIALLSWSMSLFYCVLDFFNRSYISSIVLGIGGSLLFPLVIYLNSKQYRSVARNLLMVFINLLVFVAVTTTPFDDGGRFFLIPTGLMTLILCELYEVRSIALGLSLPIVTYFLSLFIGLPTYEVTQDSGMAQEVAKVVNFAGVYLFTLAEIYVFVNFVRRMRIQAVEQSKFSALGIMSSGIAHEINNPLAIIKGRTFMVQKHLELGHRDEIQKDIDVILKTTDRIGKIIQGLRSFSRNAETDPLDKINSSELIQMALDLCSERFQGAGVKVILDEKDKFEIEGREAQLVQVLVNLLSNAYDAVQSLSDKWVKIEVSTSEIKVIDSGPGIPKDIAKKIMQPFYTTKEVGKGTGLGLSISKGIMDKHNGELYLDSDSTNTSFVIRFKVKS